MIFPGLISYLFVLKCFGHLAWSALRVAG